MNAYYKGKIEINLNNKFIGYASSVGIIRDTRTGTKRVNLVVEKHLINNKVNGEENKAINEEDNYDAFFQKFSKAFSKK